MSNAEGRVHSAEGPAKNADPWLIPGSYVGPDGPEQPLPRGDVTEGLVRVGQTVRRPRQFQSGAVAEYLRHLASADFTGAPRFLGTDDVGRDVLDFIPGQVAAQQPQAWAADIDRLCSVAGLVRDLLGASHGFPLQHPDHPWFRDHLTEQAGMPADPEVHDVVGHCDITPQNVVFDDDDGAAVALIDFDLAGPTTRLREARNVALHWAQLVPPEDRQPAFRDVDPIARTCAIADVFALTAAERSAFVNTNRQAAQRSWHVMRHHAVHLGGGWARMWREGVGDQIQRRQRWLDVVAPDLHRAITRSGA